MADAGSIDTVDAFTCQICHCTMSGQVTYDTHMQGVRHIRNLKRRADGEPAGIKSTGFEKKKVARTVVAKELIEECVKPCLGIEYITEVQQDVKDEYIPPHYTCFLCTSRNDVSCLISHLTGRQHRLNYFKTHNPVVYEEIEKKETVHIEGQEETKKKRLKAEELEKYAADVEVEVGRKEMKILVERSTDKSSATYIAKTVAGTANPVDPSKGTVEERTCQLCNVTCTSDIVMQSHLEGSKHKRKLDLEAQGTVSNVGGIEKKEWVCKICSVTCTGPETYRTHMDGIKHKRNTGVVPFDDDPRHNASRWGDKGPGRGKRPFDGSFDSHSKFARNDNYGRGGGRGRGRGMTPPPLTQSFRSPAPFNPAAYYQNPAPQTIQAATVRLAPSDLSIEECCRRIVKHMDDGAICTEMEARLALAASKSLSEGILKYRTREGLSNDSMTTVQNESRQTVARGGDSESFGSNYGSSFRANSPADAYSPMSTSYPAPGSHKYSNNGYNRDSSSSYGASNSNQYY